MVFVNILIAFFVAHGAADVPSGLIVKREGDSFTVEYDFSVSKKITREQIEWIEHQSAIDFLDLSFSKIKENDLIAILEAWMCEASNLRRID